MPNLKEDEWEKIINNISIISFLQGLSIGGKIYNGYSIITNNKNKEAVSENSIYITSNDGYYYNSLDKTLVNKSNFNAYLNIDFETKYTSDGIPYLPHTELGSYTSIVNYIDVENTDNIYKYMANLKSKNSNLASTYFTALGREKYSMYKSSNNVTELKEKFKN